ncbi:hypothetical protein SAMN04490357_6004 [Streptomyces misionensis]|uniref:Uncharacterized protein n=1 Tax=Streptomyces misionensis TaxID=67331 RepID=A0A1H5DXK0_9ACTN|nr:hypothetical protein [Streptomyces misionensis]SED83572.1 hypothetical protein SAMN04490357_6004 [Streptomyces misionensis]
MHIEDNALPVPAPFMFTCDGCWQRLVLLAKKVRADADCFAEQVYLARHVSAEHPDEVPPPHTDCPLCPKYAEFPDDTGTWAQHRARDLFLPDDVARLL